MRNGDVLGDVDGRSIIDKDFGAILPEVAHDGERAAVTSIVECVATAGISFVDLRAAELAEPADSLEMATVGGVVERGAAIFVAF